MFLPAQEGARSAVLASEHAHTRVDAQQGVDQLLGGVLGAVGGLYV